VNNKDLIGLETTRDFFVSKSAIDEQNRTISFILVSQENNGTRYNALIDETYIEKLDVKGAKFQRLKTFFKDHNRSVDSAIGKVKNIRVEDNQLKADVVFGEDIEAQRVFKKYVDGILTDCSIGYRILDTKVELRQNDPALVTVTDFEIFELSAVGLGFDKGAVVGRQLNLNTGVNVMNKEIKQGIDEIRSVVDDLNIKQEATEKRTEEQSNKELETSKLKNEQNRVLEIMGLVENEQLELNQARDFIQNSISIDEVRKAVLDEKIKTSAVIVGSVPQEKQMLREIEDSIVSRCGVNVDLKDNYFRGASLNDMARHILQLNSMDKLDIAQRSMTNDQFTLLLGNIANRVLVSNFEQQEGTYHLWTYNVDLPNFKLQTDVSVKNLNGRLAKLKEKGELENLELDENGEVWKLESFGNKFTFTRQMLINDDLSAFSNIVSQFGIMAKRTANGRVYDLLQEKGDFANYKMADGKSLFDTAHKNLDTGTALNSDSLSEARLKMRRQTDGKIALNINPKYLLVSPENERVALELLTSDSKIDANHNGVVNIHKNSLDLIIESELEPKPWYLATSRKTIKTGTLAGTGGVPIVQERFRSGGGIEYECLFDFGLVVEDYRGLYKNKGL